jgi:hypothetical protein
MYPPEAELNHRGRMYTLGIAGCTHRLVGTVLTGENVFRGEVGPVPKHCADYPPWDGD